MCCTFNDGRPVAKHGFEIIGDGARAVARERKFECSAHFVLRALQ